MGTHKLLGTMLKHRALYVIVKQVHVALREETARQLKSRVHTVTFTSDMELVPDMCPERQ